MVLTSEVYGIFLSSYTSNRLCSLLLNGYEGCVCVCEVDNQLHLVPNVIICGIRSATPLPPIRHHDVQKRRHPHK